MKFIAPGTPLYGMDPHDGLGRCVAHIRAHHADAAYAVLTGDITHGGEMAGYEARQALAGLPMPLHVAIGNHDDRVAFRTAFPDVPVDDAGFVQEAFDTSVGRFIVLDTHEVGRAEGRLCTRRLAWLERELRDSTGPVFLCLHHPPFHVGLGRMDRIRLLDRDLLLDTLRPHLGRVRHLFVGHLHRMIAGSWHGIPFSGVWGTNHQIALDFVTQDVAPVSFEEPGYGVVLISPETVVVHFEEIGNSEGSDTQTQEWSGRAWEGLERRVCKGSKSAGR